MASALQELRKTAGFRTASEFACAMGIPESTYARYESNPDKIPLDRAWRLADCFGCSIDIIVEREQLQGHFRQEGDIQLAYEHLSADSKIALEKYLAFLLKEDDAHLCAEGRKLHCYEDIASDFEALYLNFLKKSASFGGFGEGCDPVARRPGFEKFLAFLAENKCLNTDAGESLTWGSDLIGQIMAGYDRLHGIKARCFSVDGCDGFRDRLFVKFDDED